MPQSSVEENLARVRAGLATHDSADSAHSRILAEHAAALREHEAHLAAQRRRLHRSSSSRRGDDALKFRFKEGKHDAARPRKRKRGKRDEGGGVERAGAHPFARPRGEKETLDAEEEVDEAGDADAAFRASLFDALAHDEGKDYWAAVYGVGVHEYERPTVRTAEGEVQGMSDEEYALWVKRKMWERLHPEEVREVKIKREREREERIRREEQGSRRERERAEEQVKAALDRGATRRWVKRWQAYQAAWAAGGGVADLPWPTEGGGAPAPDEGGAKEVRGFFTGVRRALPAILGEEVEGEELRAAERQLLKAERFRWHPDKMMQRFGEGLQADMPRVTAVWQVVDGLLGEVK